MNFEAIPGRVFLDTNIINFIFDYGEQIHDGAPLPQNLSDRAVKDIDALYNLFLTGQRASWQLAVSPYTYQEVVQTKDLNRRQKLDPWFFEVWDYWVQIVESNSDVSDGIETVNLRRRTLESGILDALPDLDDRVLICDAVTYNCDLFCTRDWGTILKHRGKLPKLPFEIVTPSEWWSKIGPWAGLWV